MDGEPPFAAGAERFHGEAAGLAWLNEVAGDAEIEQPEITGDSYRLFDWGRVSRYILRLNVTIESRVH